MTQHLPSYAVPISVIIPLYNKGPFILRTLQSVLAQTHREFECIIIDDGSTDDGPAIVRSVQDDRIRLITQINSGVSSARNRGLLSAQHDYCAFLDADDKWDPGYLTKMTQLIAMNPGSGLYFSSHRVINSNGSCTTKATPSIAKPDHQATFNLFRYFRTFNLYDWALHTSCCIVNRKTAIESGGFDERISYYEDYDLFSRIALMRTFTYLNTPLTYYHRDIPINARLTGKLPPINKHWVYYIFDSSLSHSSSSDIQYFINNFAVFMLLDYRKADRNLPNMAAIRQKVSTSRLSAKSLVRHFCPASLLRTVDKIRRSEMGQ